MTDRHNTIRASEFRRLLVAALVGVVVGVVLSRFVRMELAVPCAWDATALTFLVAVWPTIGGADSGRTEELATRDDLSRDTAR
jgi:uncharacterized membrane protein